MKEEFIQIYKTRVSRPGAAEFLQWLEGTDFFTAPASTRFHLCRENGLLEHGLHVYRRLRALYEQEFGSEAGLTAEEEETLAVCGLLHDVCKVDVYHKRPKNQKTYDPAKVAAAERWKMKHDELGDFIWESVMGYEFDDPLPYGHGEKSVYLISQYMKLSRDEAMAIRWHMGFSDMDYKAGGYSVGNAFNLCPLAVLIHVADLEASYLDEREEERS